MLLDVANDVAYGGLTLVLLQRLAQRSRPSAGQSTSEAVAELGT